MKKKTGFGCIYSYLLDGITVYIGQSVFEDPENRDGDHWYSVFKNKDRCILHSAMRKYGPERFNIIRLCVVPWESLDNMEAYYAEQYETYKWDSPGGYNMVWCGKGSRRGIKHSNETKLLQSNIAKEKRAGDRLKDFWFKKGRTWGEEERKLHEERMASEEWKAMLSKAHSGKTISESQKDKLRDAMKLWWTDERKKHRSNIMTGRTHTQATKDKCSVARMGHEVSQSTRQLLSAANIGKIIPKDVREKISKTLTNGKHKGMKRSDNARKNMSNAKIGKPQSDIAKAAQQKARDLRFETLFNKHLISWLNDKTNEKQWCYDISRKRRDGNLLDKYINILDATEGWRWHMKT